MPEAFSLLYSANSAILCAQRTSVVHKYFHKAAQEKEDCRRRRRLHASPSYFSILSSNDGLTPPASTLTYTASFNLFGFRFFLPRRVRCGVWAYASMVLAIQILNLDIICLDRD